MLQPSRMVREVPQIRVGCAGWSISSAHARYLPGEGSHLERYARVFNAVEINSSFYRPHRSQTYAKWADSTPDNFRFSVKMPRAISHKKRLRDCDGELDAFLDETGCLGAKLGALLLQLPPGFAFEARRVTAFFDRLRKRYPGPLTCEPRHASWFNGRVETVLRDRGVARVAADPARHPRAAVPAGDCHIEYFRLHGAPRMYYDAYSEVALARLTKRLVRRDRRVHERWCMFDNTAQGHAIPGALTLQALIAAHGAAHEEDAGR